MLGACSACDLGRSGGRNYTTCWIKRGLVHIGIIFNGTQCLDWQLWMLRHNYAGTFSFGHETSTTFTWANHTQTWYLQIPLEQASKLQHDTYYNYTVLFTCVAISSHHKSASAVWSICDNPCDLPTTNLKLDSVEVALDLAYWRTSFFKLAWFLQGASKETISRTFNFKRCCRSLKGPSCGTNLNSR